MAEKPEKEPPASALIKECQGPEVRRQPDTEMDAQLTTYRATDRRVYNGAPCSDMNREWAHTDGLMRRMKKADPTAAVTFFYNEGYLVSTNLNRLENPHLTGPPLDVTGNFHHEKQSALIEAILVLEGLNASNTKNQNESQEE